MSKPIILEFNDGHEEYYSSMSAIAAEFDVKKETIRMIICGRTKRPWCFIRNNVSKAWLSDDHGRKLTLVYEVI